MEQFARRPDELSSKGPMDVNWRNWKQQFLIFLKASGALDKPSDVKASLMMNLIGQAGLKIFHNFTFDPPNESEDLDLLMKKFDDYFDPKKSEAHERYAFFTSVKKSGDSLEQYISEMRVKAKTCNFGDLTDSLIRDKIILDLKDKTLRKHLLSEPELTLSQTIVLCQAHEQTAEKLLSMSKVKKSIEKDVKPKPPGDAVPKKKNNPSSSKPQTQLKKPKGCCWRCGIQHEMNKCPAWGKKCEKCGILNHFTQNCGNAPPPKNNAQDKSASESWVLLNKNMNPGPFTQIPAKVMNKNAIFKNDT